MLFESKNQNSLIFYLVTFLHTSRRTLAGVYLTKLTLSFLGVNLVLESTYIGYHLTQVAPKSDLSFCKCFSFAFGSQPFEKRQAVDSILQFGKRALFIGILTS